MPPEEILKLEKLEQGKIYYLDYGTNTQIVGRYKHTEGTAHHFYDLLHYWNGYETFRHASPACVTNINGIENLRRASKAEIHNLVKNEIEHGCI
jgi:hypothetical protein